MSYYQGRDSRLISGGMKSAHRGKRKYELGGPFSAPMVASSDEMRKMRKRGGTHKVRVIKAGYLNAVDGTGKVVKTRILGVDKTPANVEYARRGILTKGALVKTELGQVKITSRPGRDGVLNGILVDRKA